MKDKVLNIIIILLIVGIAVVLFFAFRDNNSSKLVFELNGSNHIVHNMNDKYEDLGVTLKKGNVDISNEVVVVNNVDPTVEGAYTVTYTYQGATLTRYVSVKKINSFVLLGDSDVYLLINGKYDDPKVELKVDGVDKSSEVTKSGEYNSEKSGDYKITYTYPETRQELYRNIHVSEFNDYFKINYDSKTKVTNLSLTIDIDSNKVGKYILPDKSEKSENTTYTISENGKYTFIVYDKYNNKIEKEINIDNIGKEETKVITPIEASCEASIENGKTTISVKVNKSIKKYVYNGIEATKNSYTFNKEVKTNKVVLYDNDGTTKEITCTTKEVKLGKLEIYFTKSLNYYDDAILIKSEKATIWIDGGRGKDDLVNFIKSKGVSTIDYVIGSHTEYDHINAQGLIIQRFNVKNVIYPNDIYTNCSCGKCSNEDVSAVKSALNAKNMKARAQAVPSKITVGDMELYFIAPRKLVCNKNNNSFIFILKYGNNTFMFTGDSDLAVTYQDYANDMLKFAKQLGLSNMHADVLKYPHHGNQGLSTYFLDNVTPKYVIVPNNGAPSNPSKSSLNRLASYNATVYRQSDSKTGNILITSDGKNITIKMDVS